MCIMALFNRIIELVNNGIKWKEKIRTSWGTMVSALGFWFSLHVLKLRRKFDWIHFVGIVSFTVNRNDSIELPWIFELIFRPMESHRLNPTQWWGQLTLIWTTNPRTIYPISLAHTEMYVFRRLFSVYFSRPLKIIRYPKKFLITPLINCHLYLFRISIKVSNCFRFRSRSLINAINSMKRRREKAQRKKVYWIGNGTKQKKEEQMFSSQIHLNRAIVFLKHWKQFHSFKNHSTFL